MAPSPTQSGALLARSVDFAAVVISRDEFHNHKSSAKKRPPRLMRAIFWMLGNAVLLVNHQGTRTIAAMKTRYKPEPAPGRFANLTKTAKSPMQKIPITRAEYALIFG